MILTSHFGKRTSRRSSMMSHFVKQCNATARRAICRDNFRTLVEGSRVPFEESYVEVFWIAARKNLPVTARRSNSIYFRKTINLRRAVTKPEGTPRPGEDELGSQEGTNTCDAMLNLSPTAWQAARAPSSCSKQVARHMSRRICRRSVHVRK